MALIDRIKHDAPMDDLLVWKYPIADIRIGSQLIVKYVGLRRPKARCREIRKGCCSWGLQ
jgi:hypothetical protein